MPAGKKNLKPFRYQARQPVRDVVFYATNQEAADLLARRWATARTLKIRRTSR